MLSHLIDANRIAGGKRIGKFCAAIRDVNGAVFADDSYLPRTRIFDRECRTLVRQRW